jgi:hypothetical protein
MWNKISNQKRIRGIGYCFFLILNLTFSIGIFAQETSEVTLKWQEVSGALGYVLEVRDTNKKQIFSQRISVNQFEVNELPLGVYEHRVGIINKFGKVEGYTDWVPFEVAQSKTPRIQSKTVFSAGRDESVKRIEVKGADFLDSMQIYLKKDGKIIRPIQTNIGNQGKIAYADFRIEDFPEDGMYDLVLENPRKKVAVAEKNFVIAQDKELADRIANRQAKINNNEFPPDYYDTPYWSTLWRSTVLPGWGQDYIDDQRWKLYTYPLVLVAAGAVYAKSYNDFLSARASYYQSVQLGFYLSTTNISDEVFFFNNQEALGKFNTAKTRLNQIEIGAGVIGLFAIFNLVDAFFSVRRNVVDSDSSDPIPIGMAVGESPYSGTIYLRADSTVRSTLSTDRPGVETFSSMEFFQRF